MTRISKIALFGLLTAMLIALPASSRAEEPKPATDKPSDKTESAQPKKHTAPFHGKVAAVDAKAMTFTVGTLLIHVTPDTKMTKGDQPITLADLTVGESVGGLYLKTEDGQLNAITLHLGMKAEGKPQPKPKDPSEAGGQK